MARQTREETQAAQEAAFPDKFTDGAEWVALAARAEQLPAARRFTGREFAAAIGAEGQDFPGTFAGAGLWEIRPDYEALRLAGLRLSLAGEQAVIEARRPYLDHLRQARTPQDVNRLNAAQELLNQAMKSPERRLPFSRLIKTLGLETSVLRHGRASRR